jgi:sn-glycerol 3-phosphate transport system ATP-binding protein
MVFQNYALFPHLSVADNIVFGLQCARWTARRGGARLTRWRRLVGLSALLQRKPSQLSGGQQQRVALGARAGVAGAVCLMDEPLSNLDAQLRQEMRHELRELQQRLGLTVVYVTHDQAEAMSMADQVVLLNKGRIEQNATPRALYARAGVHLRGALHRHAADEPGCAARPPHRAAATCRCGTSPAAWLGLRPEAVSLQAAGRLPAAGA